MNNAESSEANSSISSISTIQFEKVEEDDGRMRTAFMTSTKSSNEMTIHKAKYKVHSALSN